MNEWFLFEKTFGSQLCGSHIMTKQVYMIDGFYLKVSIWIFFSGLSPCVIVLCFVISNLPWFFLQCLWNSLQFWWLSIVWRCFFLSCLSLLHFWWTSVVWKLWCHMTVQGMSHFLPDHEAAYSCFCNGFHVWFFFNL